MYHTQQLLVIIFFSKDKICKKASKELNPWHHYCKTKVVIYYNSLKPNAEVVASSLYWNPKPNHRQLSPPLWLLFTKKATIVRELLPITLSCFEKSLPTIPSELYQEFANTYDIQCLVLHGNDNMYYWFGKVCN